MTETKIARSTCSARGTVAANGPFPGARAGMRILIALVVAVTIQLALAPQMSAAGRESGGWSDADAGSLGARRSEPADAWCLADAAALGLLPKVCAR